MYHSDCVLTNGSCDDVHDFDISLYYNVEHGHRDSNFQNAKCLIKKNKKRKEREKQSI